MCSVCIFLFCQYDIAQVNGAVPFVFIHRQVSCWRIVAMVVATFLQPVRSCTAFHNAELDDTILDGILVCNLPHLGASRRKAALCESSVENSVQFFALARTSLSSRCRWVPLSRPVTRLCKVDFGIPSIKTARCAQFHFYVC